MSVSFCACGSPKYRRALRCQACWFAIKKQRIRPVMETLLSRIEIDANDCWLWTGALTKSGYGKAGTHQLGDQHKTILVHRFVYEQKMGAIRDGYHLHHTCEVRRCVNPAHLEQVTPGEHMAIHDLWNLSAQQKRNAPRRTHCRRGHEFTPENTKWQTGGRVCRECVRSRGVRRYARRWRERAVQCYAELTDEYGYARARAGLMHAAKAHTCALCRCEIKPGDEHWHVNAFHTRKLCVPCGQKAVHCEG